MAVAERDLVRAAGDALCRYLFQRKHPRKPGLAINARTRAERDRVYVSDGGAGRRDNRSLEDAG